MIIILAIIATIATAIILDSINTARNNANKTSAYGIQDAAQNYVASEIAKDNEIPKGNILSYLNYKGKTPYDYNYYGYGAYTKDDGTIALALRYDDSCYKKIYNETEITVTSFSAVTCTVNTTQRWDGVTITAITPDVNGNYTVNTPDELAWIASQVNSNTNLFTGKTVYLNSDMNMGGLYDKNGVKLDGGTEWIAIGNATYKFAGNFDGQNHIISGIYINKPAVNYQGLFGITTGYIKNIVVENNYIIGASNVGVLTSRQEAGVIENSYVKNSTTQGTSSVGGLVGVLFTSANNSYAIDNIVVGITTTGTQSVGGLIGALNTNATISNSYSNSSVTGSGNYVGGLFGYAASTNTIDSCYSLSKVSGGQRVGGLGGNINTTSTVKNSYAISDSISGVSTVGGLLGSVSGTSTKIVDSHAKTNVISSSNIAGGLVGGYTTTTGGSTAFVKNSYASGTVTCGSDSCGGLIGLLHGKVENSYSTSNVIGKVSYTGGLVGKIGYSGSDNSGSYIKNSYSTGNVSGVSAVGGLVGQNTFAATPKYNTIINSYSIGNVTGTTSDIGGLVGVNNMNIINSYSTGNVTGPTIGYSIGNQASTGSTLTNLFYKETQTMAGTNNNNGIGIAVSISDLQSSSWHQNTLGFGSSFQFSNGYYPLVYKVDLTTGNATNNLIEDQIQKNIE